MTEFEKTPMEMYYDLEPLKTYMMFGSRSMASRPSKERFDPAIMIGSQIDDSTDWDFSAPYTQENHNILVNAGYIHWPAEQLGYRDELTEGVYIKTYPHKFDMSNPVIYNGVPTANVVLRNDYALFRQAWNSIDPEFYYKYLWKRSPTYDHQELALTKETIRDIMNQLFQTARFMI
jgi:hypothetical protein